MTTSETRWCNAASPTKGAPCSLPAGHEAAHVHYGPQDHMTAVWRDPFDHLTDHQLAVRYMTANLLASYEDNGNEVSELDAEVRRRFNVASTDGLADKVTGFHMSAEEAIEWAATAFDDWKGWLTGALTHGPAR